MSQLTTLFTDIADSLRAKEGSSEQIPAMNFPERIDGLAGKMQIVDESGEQYEITKIDYTEEKGKPIIEKVADIPSDQEYELVDATNDGGFIIKNASDDPSKLLSDGSIQWSIASRYFVDCIDDFIYVAHSNYVEKYDSGGTKAWTATDSYLGYMNDYNRKIVKEDGIVYVFSLGSPYTVQIKDSVGRVVRSGSLTLNVKDVWKDGSIYATDAYDGTELTVWKYNKNLTRIWSYANDLVSGSSPELVLSNQGYPYMQCSQDFDMYYSRNRVLNRLDPNDGYRAMITSLGECSFYKNKKGEICISTKYSVLKISNTKEVLRCVVNKEVIQNEIGDVELSSDIVVNNRADRPTAVVSYNEKYYVCRPDNVDDCVNKIFEVTSTEYTALSNAKQMQNNIVYGVADNAVYKVIPDISKESATATLQKSTGGGTVI